MGVLPVRSGWAKDLACMVCALLFLVMADVSSCVSLMQAAPKRRQPDEYDQEYDLGRVKKVRNKAAETGADDENGDHVRGRVGSRVFDAAWQAKQRGQGGGSSNHVQLRGNKLKRQQREEQQRRPLPM